MPEYLIFGVFLNDFSWEESVNTEVGFAVLNQSEGTYSMGGHGLTKSLQKAKWLPSLEAAQELREYVSAIYPDDTLVIVFFSIEPQVI